MQVLLFASMLALALSKTEYASYENRLIFVSDTEPIVNELYQNHNISSDQISTIESYYREKHSLYKGSANPNPWDFGGSLFFTMGMMATVGYGYYIPETDASRILIIIFLIPGICICAVCLYHYSFVIHEWISDKVFDKDLNTLTAKEWIKLGSLTFTIPFLILVPVYYTKEDWSFLYTVYYFFVTGCSLGQVDEYPMKEIPFLASFFALNAYAMLMGNFYLVIGTLVEKAKKHAIELMDSAKSIADVVHELKRKNRDESKTGRSDSELSLALSLIHI